MMTKYEKLALQHQSEKLEEARAELRAWRDWANGGYVYNHVTKKIEEKPC